MQLREYFRAIYNDWVTLMSGLGSIILAFSGAYSEYVIAHVKVALWIAAALCFVITSYRVWAREHSQTLALATTNEELELRLSPSLDVLFGTDYPFIHTEPEYDATKSSASVTYYGLQIRNSGATTAQRVRVEVEGFRGADGVIKKIHYWDPLPPVVGTTSLDPGEVKSLYLFHTKPSEGPFVTHPYLG